MNRTLAGVAWIALYLVVVLAPMFLMLLPPVPSGRRFWLEFSVALGFVGLIQIAVQFVLIARFRRLTAPYGIDVILQYHRRIAVVAVAVILLHPLIIFIDNPSRLVLLNPVTSNWASRFALLSVLALVSTVVASLFRERLRLRYERWRLLHLTLGVLTIAFAQLHVSLAGLYTNVPWKQSFWITSAAAMVALVLYLRLVRPARQRNYRWRVAEVRPERGDTHTLVLEPVEHEGLRFDPGQFAWVKLAGTPFTLEEHPFSFSSSAEHPERLEFGIKALGDFSGAVGAVQPGRRAYLDGPHGAFSIDRYQAPGYVFIAGGVGVTPIMSCLRTMADRADPRPVLLVYADKEWDGVAYREEIHALRQRMNLKVVYVLENPPEDWDGERGFVTADLLRRCLPDDRFQRDVFLCGPPVMMDVVHAALLERGFREDNIHLERFVLA